MLHIHCLSCLLFCLLFFIFVLSCIFHCQQCSFSYLLVSNDGVGIVHSDFIQRKWNTCRVRGINISLVSVKGMENKSVKGKIYVTADF